MSDHQPFNEMPNPRHDYSKLAIWLQQVLGPAPQRDAIMAETPENESQLAATLGSNYHLHYYQQLPDFAMALLTNNVQAAVRYTTLLYHLASCRECHSAYLDLYDALRAAVDPQGNRSLLGQGTRTLSATPHRILGHFCQMLISQAEAVLRQARHDHTDQDAAARSLLQMALRVSAHISQSTIRRHALRDLVGVATLFDSPSVPKQDAPDVHTYTLAPTRGMGRGKVLRHSDTVLHSYSQEQNAIEIQSNGLKGRIVQQDQKLELHLEGLDAALRGRYLIICVPLGSLIESVRWHNDNPQAIRSTTPVDATGTLITPLGETEMRLSNPEERNLLESMFLRLLQYPQSES